ncbi:DNA polymerase III subunit alpha [bacterium]|nr:DNA polymerase III subunit alpha [bacterium]
MHLHLHSFYSFLAGTLSIDRIIEQAGKAGYTALALTDTNNVTGVMEFYVKCRNAGIKPVIGAELRAGGVRAVALAKNWDGYAAICTALTELVVSHPPARVVTDSDASDTSEVPEDTEGNPLALLRDILRTHCDENVILLCSHEWLLSSLGDSRSECCIELLKHEEGKWPSLQRLGKERGFPLVAANDVYFGAPGGRKLHGMLRAIATNTTLGTLPQGVLAPETAYFIGEEEFQRWFKHVPEALAQRQRIIDACTTEFDTTTSKFTRFHDVPDSAKLDRLRTLTEEGFRFRYPNASHEARERIEKEFVIIRDLGFVDYFLVAWDLVRYAKHRNYPYVGRGSGANSIIAYCLQITNVDPIELDLFFERFLNPERKSPPDFDIDFSWRNRDEIIDYALAKYGSDRTAMICTISTFNPRGALREIGKVLGFSAAEIKQITSLLPAYGSVRDLADEGSPVHRQVGSVLRSPYGKDWSRAAFAILEFPNHYGIHSGGVILAPERMTRYTATQIAPKGVRITQQDMFSMEDWRLEKLDILSTRGLGTFEDTMQEVRRRTGKLPPVMNYKIACEDTRTKDIMRRGETVGCFYVESPAMIQLLKKLRTDTFEMLTAASSIIRPGVAQSGMMQAFIERFHDSSKINPPHPKMAELLRSTYGVMVYQEDVIKVAHFIGKLSLGEADLLRRAMSGKMRSHEAMRALKETFFRGCIREGIAEPIVQEIWRQMESFAGYSFCKAHSASYAVLSFQEAYLKAHYPALFLCSVLNNQGGYYRPEVYVQEARRLGLRVLLPDVNVSDELHYCPDDRSIQLGFLHIKGLSERSQLKILAERRENGKFTEFDDFLARSGASFEDVGILVRCGACDCFQEDRPALMVRTRLYFNRQRRNDNAPALQLHFDSFDDELEQLESYSPSQIAQIELETFTYTVSTHVLSHFAEELRNTVKADALERFVGRRVQVGGWMIAAKLTRTRKGERMMFINLDDSVGRIDVVLFPRCFSEYAHLLRTAGPFIIYGRVAKEYDVINIVAERVTLLKKE